MPLMGSIYVGTSGLQTSQNALNTTAHNMSNMDTTGFVRQQVLEGDRYYNTLKAGSPSVASQQVGLGVVYSKVRQVRDYFLDQSYRRESGRSAFYDEAYAAMNEVEDLLDEMDDDASFNKSLTNFWSSLQELAKTPDDTVVQRLVIQNAQSFLTNASQVYQGLIDYQNELNAHIRDKVVEINELGHKIHKLNEEIRKIECGGIETANDLRDERNLCLDKLAALGNIEYNEDIYGSIRVKFEGVDFVVSDMVYDMDTYLDTQTGFYTPFWQTIAKYTYDANGEKVYDITGAEVFDMSLIISSEKNTDVGELRSMLYIRGDKVANYTDIPVKPEVPERTAGMSELEYSALVKKYDKEMEKYDADVEYYNHTVAQSVCMNIQAEFDQLIHSVVTKVNEIIANASDSATGYLCNDDGSPIQIFQKISSDGYTWDGTKWEYMEEDPDPNKTDTLYSISNLMINPELIREAGKMGFVRPDKTVDYDTVKALIAAFDADDYCLNPNVTTKCSLNTYYTNLVSQVANSGSVYKNISESQQKTVDNIDYSREQITGVSSDEELTNMIKFQNAYNAASRYINVVDEMLEHIITQLG